MQNHPLFSEACTLCSPSHQRLGMKSLPSPPCCSWESWLCHSHSSLQVFAKKVVSSNCPRRHVQLHAPHDGPLTELHWTGWDVSSCGAEQPLPGTSHRPANRCKTQAILPSNLPIALWESAATKGTHWSFASCAETWKHWQQKQPQWFGCQVQHALQWLWPSNYLQACAPTALTWKSGHQSPCCCRQSIHHGQHFVWRTARTLRRRPM